MEVGCKSTKKIPKKRVPKYKAGDKIRYSLYNKESGEQIYTIIQVYADSIPRYLCDNGRYKRMLFEDDMKGV